MYSCSKSDYWGMADFAEPFRKSPIRTELRWGAVSDIQL